MKEVFKKVLNLFQGFKALPRVQDVYFKYGYREPAYPDFYLKINKIFQNVF